MRYRHDWDTEGKRNSLYGRRWRTARAAFLASEPLCVMCRAAGTLAPATVVDHKVPHKGDVGLFWDQKNWQALCEHHHNSEKARLEIRGYSQQLGEDGWPIDPEHPSNKGSEPVSGKSRPDELLPIAVEVLLVVGPPASGKTTWCRDQMNDADVLIDFDEIDGDINGRARNRGRLIVPILRERNTRLLNAAAMTEGRVFLPMMGARAAHRAWWRRKLGNVTVVMMDTPREECGRRLQIDVSRRHSLDDQSAALDRWFTTAERTDVDRFVSGPEEFVL